MFLWTFWYSNGSALYSGKVALPVHHKIRTVTVLSALYDKPLMSFLIIGSLITYALYSLCTDQTVVVHSKQHINTQFIVSQSFSHFSENKCLIDFCVIILLFFRNKKTIPTFTSVPADFNMTDPVMLTKCPHCGSRNQKSHLVFHR